MTEQEWLICTDPNPMLSFLRGKASDRKLRLFACACCRRVWHLLTDPRSQRAVEVAEQYADGLAGSMELRSVYEKAAEVLLGLASQMNEWVSNREKAAQAMAGLFGDDIDSGIFGSAQAAAEVANIEWKSHVVAVQAASGTCSSFRRRLGIERRSKTVREAQKAARRKWETARSHQAHLLRDVFGLLPLHSVVVDCSWLAWNDRTIPKLAQGIYDDRAFDRLPILADALEEAGCDNADILNHCRQPDEHVRGCWVVDMLLGKS